MFLVDSKLDLEAKTPPSVSLISNVKDVDNAIPINDF